MSHEFILLKPAGIHVLHINIFGSFLVLRKPLSKDYLFEVSLCLARQISENISEIVLPKLAR